MGGCKRDVIWRVKVPCGHLDPEWESEELVDLWDYGSTVRNSQAARDEIVLHVNDEQCWDEGRSIVWESRGLYR